MDKTKVCKTCKQVLLEDNFYKTRKWLQSDCKKCANKRRKIYKITRIYTKKPTGLDKLDEKLKQKIIDDIFDPEIKLSEVSRKYGKSYGTLVHWKKKLLNADEQKE